MDVVCYSFATSVFCCNSMHTFRKVYNMTNTQCSKPPYIYTTMYPAIVYYCVSVLPLCYMCLLLLSCLFV